MRALMIAVTLVSACQSPEVWSGWRAGVAGHREPTPTVGERPQRWRRRARLPPPYQQACDLASTPSALIVAASVDALTEDGAAIFRLGAELESLFTWDGQGFLRAHAFGDVVVVPDADAPFGFFTYLFDWDVDGYVFVIDVASSPPRVSQQVLPAVYHVFDVARLNDGRLVASTGAYPPGEVAYFSPRAPPVLFADAGDAGDASTWQRVLALSSEGPTGVNRFTYLEVLDDGVLLAAVQSFNNDLPPAVRIELSVDAPPAIVEGIGGAVLRWAQWRGAIYAVEQGRRETRLLVSRDQGVTFEPLAVPEPQSLAPTADALFLLAGGALWQSMDGSSFEQLTGAVGSLAHEWSPLVSAPLVVHDGTLWAGSPTTGEIFEAVPAL